MSNIQTDPKNKAVYSLILGIVNIVILLIVTFYQYGEILLQASWVLLVTLLIAIIGLIFGIMGLRSSKKKLAIAGIILGIIGLGSSISTYIINLVSLA